MADNIDVTAGAGKTIAADDVGGVLYQRVKLTTGADGVANDVAVATPLPTSYAGAAWTSAFQYTTSADMTTAAFVTAAPTAGQKIVITDILIAVQNAGLYSLKEETSGTVMGAIQLPANGSIQFSPRGKWKLNVADKRLQLQASVTGNVYATIFYTSEA